MPKVPSTPSPKRASTSSPKKTKTPAVIDHSAARALVQEVLIHKGELDVLPSQVLSIAAYTRHLEGVVGAVVKTREEIDIEADKLKKAAVSGITKQMKWRPSCKWQGSAWVYDGVCSDPVVFAAMFGLDDPPTWPRKMKKFSPDEFQDVFGDIKSSAQWHNLYIHGDVNVSWREKEGTFKLTGKYGIYKETLRSAAASGL